MSLQEPTDAPAGLDNLDPLLQHRSRLGTMVLLSNTDAMSFTRLRELLKGNRWQPRRPAPQARRRWLHSQ